MERYASRKHCSLSTAAGRDEREDQVRHVELKKFIGCRDSKGREAARQLDAC